MNYPTPHYHYFNPNNHFIGIRTLSKDLVEKSVSFFGNTLWQTNTDNQLSLEEYNSKFNKKAKTYYEQFFKQNQSSLDYKFCGELFNNYLTNLDNFLAQNDRIIKPKYLIKSPLRFSVLQKYEKKFLVRLFLNPIRKEYKTVLSNKKKVDSLLDYLTETFFIQDKKYFGLEQIWILFLENLYSYKKTFEEEEKDEQTISKKHYNTLITRHKPFSWGWYEIQIKCFSDSFIDTLIDSLTLKSNIAINPNELCIINEFSKEVLSRMESLEKGEKDSRGFSTIGDYVSHNINKLSNAIKFYENNRVENDNEVCIEVNNSNLDNFSKTPYSEGLYNIFKNFDFDFIDYFKGKSRSEREENFNIIKNLLIKEKIIVHSDTNEYGIFWLTGDKKFRGKKIMAFYQTLIRKSWVQEPDDKQEEILKKIQKCFGLKSLEGITTRNFEDARVIKLMSRYGEIFDFIPQYQNKFSW